MMMAQSNNEDVQEDLEYESETLNFDRPDFKFKPNEVHEWKQQGPYVVCKGCELIHAQYIGIDKLMIGLNDKGQPIFKLKK